MADMQRLMDVVRRLEAQGINVVDFLEGQAGMPAEQPFNGMDISNMPMPEFKPFTGPGPGAVVTERDMEIMRRRMMQDRVSRQNPMAGLLQLFGGR